MAETVPISWDEVAYVGFYEGEPVIISTAKPHVLIGTFFDCVENAEHGMCISSRRLREEVSRYEWKLYRVSDARALFAGESNG